MLGLLGDAPFVGREQELDVLSARLDEAAAGRGGLVLIAGEPGIGKTRLADQLSTLARGRGSRVLWGRCFEGEGAPAFWPWVEVLRAYVRDASTAELQAQPGSALADAAQLVPEIRSLFPHLPQGPPPDAPESRFRLFDAVATLLRSASGRDVAGAGPLLVILDDVHWADAPSLLLLEFLARELTEARLLIVATYRDVEVRRGQPLARTLGNVAGRLRVTRIALRGLSVADVARLVEAAMVGQPPGEFVSAIVGRTDGNPLFTTELVRLLAAEGRLAAPRAQEAQRAGVPPTVRDVIGRRLDRLSDECGRALSVAAVLGGEFGIDALERAAEGLATGPGGREMVVEALAEAETAHVIAAVPGAIGRYRFTHALIRETVYEELPTARREWLHRHVAEVIERSHDSDLDAHLATLAAHYRLAGAEADREKAIEYAQRAGQAAMAVLAWEEAAAHWQTALELLGQGDEAEHGRNGLRRCELLLSLAEAQYRAAESTAARASYREAALVARRLGSSELLARAALGFSGFLGFAPLADVQRAAALLDEALDALGAGDSPLRCRLLGALSEVLGLLPLTSGSRARLAALSEETVTIARRLGDAATLAFALNERHWALRVQGSLAERTAVAAEMVQLAEAAGDRELALKGRRHQIADLMDAGEIAAVDAAIAEFGRLAQRSRLTLYQWYLRTWQAMRALLDGLLDEAGRIAQEARQIGLRVDSPLAEHIYERQLVVLLREQGRLAEFSARVAGDRRDAGESGNPERPPWLRRELRVLPAWIAAEQGDVDEARAEFARLAASGFADLSDDGAWWLQNAARLAEVCSVVGDARHAALLYNLLLPEAGRNVVNPGNPAPAAYHGAVEHYLGLLAASLHRLDDAVRHFDEAMAMHSRMGARPWLVRTQRALAEALLRRRSAGDAQRAESLRQEALAACERFGLVAAAGTVRDGLERSPAPAGTAAAYPDGLSAREVEVLCWVAAGRSNREIADALVLSVTTVQNHVANIYRKTGIHTRAEAAAYALRHEFQLPQSSED